MSNVSTEECETGGLKGVKEWSAESIRIKWTRWMMEQGRAAERLASDVVIAFHSTEIEETAEVMLALWNVRQRLNVLPLNPLIYSPSSSKPCILFHHINYHKLNLS